MRAVTLNQNYQFKRLYRRQPAGVSSLLVTYAAKNRLGYNRIGITTTKKIGKAHQRNRARRVIREAWRLTEASVAPGYDFVFVARGRTTACSMQEVRRAMQKQLASFMRP